MPHEIDNEYGSTIRQRKFHSSWVLEMCLLSVLLRSDAYGYKIAKLEGLQLSESTIYPILRRLTTNGYLETYTQQHNAKLRKVYRVTTEGIERLAELKNWWHGFADTINHLLNGNE
jgi:PadR family transcriptional regulator PadR